LIFEMFKLYENTKKLGFNFKKLSYINNIKIDFILSFGKENLYKWDWDHILLSSYNLNSEFSRFKEPNNYIIFDDLKELPKSFLIEKMLELLLYCHNI